MAEIRVLILQQGINNIVDTWIERDDCSTCPKWKESATLWPKRLLANTADPMEVFFCLDKEVLGEGFDSPFLHRVIQRAHRSMWNADVYIVIDKDWQPEDRDPEQPEPYSWAEQLLENKLTDILEWSVQPNSNYSEAARRSRERMKVLGNHPPHRSWKCLFQKPLSFSSEEESLLSPFLISSSSELTGEDCLIVLRNMDDAYLADLEEVLQQSSSEDIIVGVVDRIDRLPRDLVTFCKNKGIGLVRLHGITELYYLLQKLNDPKLNDCRLDSLQLKKSVATAVRVTNPQFKSHSPQLLITHSFLAGDPEGCLSAANDTWDMISDLPSEVRVKIYPAIESVKLASIVTDLGHILAWIHIGHGDVAKGLQQSDDQLFKTAEDWLRSFAGYNSSLALVMLSACGSEKVAQQFAQAGVGVAIGFAQKVHQRVCVELTKRVVNAALRFNGERIAVLAAFDEGYDVLKTADPEAAPLAFWASH